MKECGVIIHFIEFSSTSNPVHIACSSLIVFGRLKRLKFGHLSAADGALQRAFPHRYGGFPGAFPLLPDNSVLTDLGIDAEVTHDVAAA